jgi:putative colanic acid biosynthesis acetyltransferase WcaF
MMRLDQFQTNDFDRGAPRSVEALWMAANRLMLSSWLPGSGWRVRLLRVFGAQVGRSVVIKPGVRVKFPWRLVVGDHSWIGEDVWIDNLAQVTVADHVCISQGAYFCTGNHDWSRETFDLVVQEITVETGAWVGAKSVVGPGAKIQKGAVLTAGSVASGTLYPYTIYQGNKAVAVGHRRVSNKN